MLRNATHHLLEELLLLLLVQRELCLDLGLRGTSLLLLGALLLLLLGLRILLEHGVVGGFHSVRYSGLKTFHILCVRPRAV